MGRPGVTPVVAIVLLLMMTVAAAGAGYAWVQEIQGQAQEGASDALRLSLDLKDATCTNRTVTVDVKNDGEKALAGEAMDVYVYDVDDALVGEASTSVAGESFLQVGGLGNASVTVGSLLVPGNRYAVEAVFPDDDVTLTGSCQAGPLVYTEDFEDGDVDGWSTPGIDSSTVHTGTYSKQYNNDSGNVQADLYRNITVPAGTYSIGVTAWVYDSANTEDSGRIGVLTYDQDGALTSPWYCTQTADNTGCQDESDPNFSPWTFETCNGGWCELTHYYATPANTTTITFAWDGMDDAGGGSNYYGAYIDDITITVDG